MNLGLAQESKELDEVAKECSDASSVDSVVETTVPSPILYTFMPIVTTLSLMSAHYSPKTMGHITRFHSQLPS